jgi:hypothetical protein
LILAAIAATSGCGPKTADLTDEDRVLAAEIGFDENLLLTVRRPGGEPIRMDERSARPCRKKRPAPPEGGTDPKFIDLPRL